MNKNNIKPEFNYNYVKQIFNDINIRLLCCRYWILEEWKFIDLSYPFWRIYHNNISGAKIKYNGVVTELKKETIVLIPPNTPFSTELNKKDTSNNENVVGRKFTKKDSVVTLAETSNVDHLFIHFSLGFPLDSVKNDIISIKCEPYFTEIIAIIQQYCLEDDSSFNFKECLVIEQFISSCLLKIQNEIWKFGMLDKRVFNAMQKIEKDFKHKITNDQLAYEASMAINSFARLFKNSTGISVQQYIIKTKIEASCSLMHHSNKSIDEIAFECGFSDRHHFSKTFKKVMSVNPAAYKKKSTIM